MPTKAQKALATIPVAGSDKLEQPAPREEWLHRKIAVDRRRRRERDSRILLAWLRAEDKEAEIQRQAECWGLSVGRVKTAIEKMRVDGAVVAHLAAETTVLRQNKIAEILQAFQDHRDELYGQLDELEAARADGETWYEIEDVSGKDFRTKRVRVNTQIREVNREIMQSFKAESDALAQYMTRPNEVQDHRHLHVHGATDEFKHIFDNLNKAEEVSPDETRRDD